MTTTPPPATSTRSTAAVRREHLLEVAMVEFASRGYEGGSTERIAKAAGISQPYVFRLFGSKLQLFLATIGRCLDETLEMFVDAAAGLEGEAALVAIGEAYGEAILTNPTRLQVQLVGYAACDQPDVREAMRSGFGRLVEYAERVSGAGPERIAEFFAKGMLFNVMTAMQLPTDPISWGDRLIVGCTAGKDEGAAPS
jgi:AcrR family transcriptional regulator